MTAEDATVCTVATPYHWRMIAYNYQFSSALNPGAVTPWIVVDNKEIHVSQRRIREILKARHTVYNPETSAATLQQEKGRDSTDSSAVKNLPNLMVLDGLSVAETSAKLPAASPFASETADQFDFRKNKNLQSYHHAFGIERAIDKVATRFAVVMDPDLYVVRPEWISEIVDYMGARKLAAFGAPWNPRYYQKIRYFPCTHLLVLDLKRIERRPGLLLPDLLGQRSMFVPKFWSAFCLRLKASRLAAARFLIRHLSAAFAEDIAQRRLIGQSRDTGFALREQFRQNPALRAETLCAVFRDSDGFVPDTVSRLQRNRLIELLLPDRLSYRPKRCDYVTNEDFNERGYPGARRHGWEEFTWRGKPFAFHVRGELQRARGDEILEACLTETLNAFLERYRHRPLNPP